MLDNGFDIDGLEDREVKGTALFAPIPMPHARTSVKRGHSLKRLDDGPPEYHDHEVIMSYDSGRG